MANDAKNDAASDGKNDARSDARSAVAAGGLAVVIGSGGGIGAAMLAQLQLH